MDLLSKLIITYKEHGKIIVGCDFDDTIFSYSEGVDVVEIEDRINLLKSLKDRITLCLYTVSDSQSLLYKVALMKEWGIKPDYINCSPVKLGNGDKPFFNILLDDNAGLKEATNVLNSFQILTS